MEGWGILIGGAILVAIVIGVVHLLDHSPALAERAIFSYQRDAADTPQSPEERTRRLEAEISHWAAKDFMVVMRTDNTAQLVRRKTFSLVWSLLWLLLFGVGFPLYVVYYLTKRDNLLYIVVSPSGRLFWHGPLGQWRAADLQEAGTDRAQRPTVTTTP